MSGPESSIQLHRNWLCKKEFDKIYTMAIEIKRTPVLTGDAAQAFLHCA
jgi:hypothetical protein